AGVVARVAFLPGPYRAAFRLQFERERPPFRATDRAEQHRIARLRLGQRIVGQGRAGYVIGRAADQPLADLEARDVAAIEKLDDAHDLAHDFRADAVARQDEDFAV